MARRKQAVPHRDGAPRAPAPTEDAGDAADSQQLPCKRQRTSPHVVLALCSAPLHSLRIAHLPVPLRDGADVSNAAEVRVFADGEEEGSCRCSLLAGGDGRTLAEASLGLPYTVAAALAALAALGRATCTLSLSPVVGIAVLLPPCAFDGLESAATRTLLAHLHAPAPSPFDARELYAQLRRASDCALLQESVPQLLPTLRPYQSRAAAWMVAQEKGQASGGTHPLWRRCDAVSTHPEKDSPAVFFTCEATGALARSPPPAPMPPKGGILADEMGLGKSVELLALISAHKWAAPPPTATPEQSESAPDWKKERTECVCGARGLPSDASLPSFVQAWEQQLWVQCDCCHGWSHAACVGYRKRRNAETFTCGRCAAWHAGAQATDACGTTLIVCPAPILGQWLSELTRHVAPGALTIRTYEGQHQAAGGPGGCGAGVTTARELATCDVVLCSYDTLRAELHRDVDDGAAGRSLRGVKQYHVIPTPLTRLSFWRVCLDEAQLVESSTAAATAMARRLRCVHRWCVTGTPISRGVHDLFGLLAFLEAKPLCDTDAWRAVIGAKMARGDGDGAAQSLALVLRPLLWRSSRVDVADELALPPQAALLTRLKLSPLERHFYAQQHSRCAADAARSLAGDSSDTPLAVATLRAVMRPLLRLRQACDHPQIGSGGLTGAGGLVAGVLSMPEIHTRLADRARVAAEEAQRAVAMDLNALAGVALLQEDPPGAVALYRSVLAVETDGLAQTPPLKLDALQRLHTRDGLAFALARCPPGAVAPTLRDGALPSEAASIRHEYLAAFAASVGAAERDLAKASAAADPALLPGEARTWFLDALTAASRQPDRGAALAARLADATQQRWQDAQVCFTDAAGAQLVLVRDLQAMGAARTRLLALSRTLADATAAASEADVYTAGHCAACRGPLGVPGVRCRHCKAVPEFDAAENALFGRQMRVAMPGRHIQEGDVGAGRSAPSSAEIALKALAAWATRNLGPHICTAEWHTGAKAHLDQMEAMRREFQKASAAALAQRTALAARDELAMATTRLRLRAPGETVAADAHHILAAGELPSMQADVCAQRAVHEADLMQAKAKLRWLRQLRSRGEGEAQEVCPICQDTLPEELSVLPCGHSVCVRCTVRLASRAAEASAFPCPTCRSVVPLAEVCTVGGAALAAVVVADAAEPLAAQASALMAVAVQHAETGEHSVTVSGQWGTKVDAVVRRLLWLRGYAPGCKVIVFSEWLDVLLVLQQALTANDLPCVRSGGGRTAAANAAVAAFRTDAALMALLMPIARGANGLTLVEANHVILVEPLLDPGAEAQATKRVDRIGQKLSSCVHRFVVQDSIEENVHNLSTAKAGDAKTALKASEIVSLLR